jgi:hypothetical protein
MVEEIRNFEGLALEYLDTQRLDLVVRREEMALTASRGKLGEQSQPHSVIRVCRGWLRLGWLRLFSIAVGGRHGADALCNSLQRRRRHSLLYCAQWSDRGGRIAQQ